MSLTMPQPWFKRVIAFISITVWMTWAYLRLRPPASLVHHGQLLVNRYNTWSYQNLAYSDIVKLYQTRFLYLHLVPYIQNRIEYPVVTGLFMSLAALGHGIQQYFFITFLVFWLIALGVYWLLERLIPDTAFFFGLFPLLVVYGLLNWDLLGIVFMVLGYYAYQRERYVASAIWFALGVFAKLFPIFFLPFIVADLWRRRDGRTLGRMVLAFLATAAVLNVPFAVGNFANWSYFFSYNAGRGLGADIYANEWVHGVTVVQADAFSFVVVVLAVLYFMWWVYRGGRVVDAASLSFAVFLIVNKVYSPQYTLWIFVLAILAEWPIWTYIVLTLAGLTDYVNSFTVLHFVSSRSPATGWYVNHVFFVGVLYRYVSLAVTAAGAGVALALNPKARALEHARSRRAWL
ncbi:MAG: glycosyltransferase 87 family protein [Firmicutes bacterium]|nr:glycosyltransferase 87 family protein [Bacillota bacterium]